MKAFHKTYGALAARHPEYDISDPDMMSNFEKQLVAQYSLEQTPQSRANELRMLVPGTQTPATKIPLDAHLHTWGGAIPYLGNDIFPEDDGVPPPAKNQLWKPKTGVHGPVNAKAVDQSSIIRPVQFRTLSEAEAKDRSLSRDCATTPLIFPAGAKRAKGRLVELSGHATDPTVADCLRRFFDPAVGIPFVPADVGRYFPVDLLLPKPERESDSGLDGQTADAFQPPTTLLDDSDADVLFTKNKAPFTRSDISAVRAFGVHWDALELKRQEEATRALSNGEHIIKQAFHSKNIVETTLGLIDRDCTRIRSGTIGKTGFKDRSIWQTAAAMAPLDHSGLAEYRDL
jgi:hypothetical protein